MPRFQESDQRYRRCLENAKSQVRNQSELAINGHDVQRRIEGVCEKFLVSNYQLYSERLRQWKDEIVNHPLISSSDEVDIHWAVLQLLLDVARNPVVAMTDRVIKNNGKLIDFPVARDEPEASLHHHTMDRSSCVSLDHIEDHLPVSDELSDWSDDDEVEISENYLGITAGEKNISLPVAQTRPLQFPASFKPPEKEKNYTELANTNSKFWFLETTQNRWWSDEKTKATVNSKLSSANFAEGWNRYLDTLSMGFIADKNLSTTPEYILLREIIWMLVTPAKKCKFFRVENHCVLLNSNVTTTSCSLPIIQSFLCSITSLMTHLLQLREFIDLLKEQSQPPLPVVMEIYAGCLMEHIQSLEQYVLDVEIKLMEQNDAVTSLIFIEELRSSHMQLIDTLYRIHCDVVGEWRGKANYVSSSYFLSKLWQRLECPLAPLENNLAVSILVPCLQSFLAVFDSWWSLGQLHDYTDEFPITEWGEVREFPTELRQTIAKCPLIQFMIEHCRESHVVLNHLTAMNRTSILSEVIVERPSYHEFLRNFLRAFKLPPRETEETQTESPVPTNEYYCELMELLQLEEQVKRDSQREEKDLLTAKEMFELFQSSGVDFNLPFLDLILKSLRLVLMPRIEATHHKVAQIFLDELKIVNHFRSVNWVLLLESPAMYDFYTDLFVDIEADYNNLSSYQLTAKLDACLHAQHPQMESLFTVEIDRHYYKTELDTILDCLTKLKIEYNFQAGEGVIDFNTTTVYNRAFSFLLQIKWALWLLENLKYGDHLVRVKFFKQPNVLDFSIRRMGILRFWLLSSVKNVHAYLMHNVVECETQQLEQSLRGCTSIASIQKCHERFLGRVEERCFLGEGQRELQAVLQEFLNFVLIFRDYWHQLQDISNRDYRLERTESKKVLLDIRIDHLEETYSNIHQCLIEKLQKETKGQADGHGG